MSFRKWIIIFISALILISLAIAGFNVFVDPFGVFGDIVFDDYGYNMTSNPRISKIEYLKRHHTEYDSYIIGCSKTSSYSTKMLNEYYGASFYNMLMYGGDMYDIEKTAVYIINEYQPKNIIINMGLEETTRYNVESDSRKQNLHASVEGENPIAMYTKYAVLNPQYAIDKIINLASRDYLLTSANVFIPETGVYDKSVRDVAYIGSVEEFLENNSEEFSSGEYTESMGQADKCLESIQTIVTLCREKGIDFKLFISPVSSYELRHYPKDKLVDFWVKLADITEFYDFTGYNSYITTDPRYYYDEYHFRNCVGDMALAYVFGDKDVFVPEGFGFLVNADNAKAHAESSFEPKEITADNEATIPVLLYHHIVEEYKDNSMTVSTATFEAQIKALADAGYTAVFVKDLINFVYSGTELPEKCVLITFDDGYESNYTYAYPILEKYGMKATIFTMGIVFGTDKYADTGKKTIPHFGAEEAKEMTESGVIELGSHTYNMHQADGDGENPRKGAIPIKNETDREFAKAFKEDNAKLQEIISTDILAYPYGRHHDITDVCAKEEGFLATFTVKEGKSTIVKGLPQSLYNLKRIGVYETTLPHQLIERLSK